MDTYFIAHQGRHGECKSEVIHNLKAKIGFTRPDTELFPHIQDQQEESYHV